MAQRVLMIKCNSQNNGNQKGFTLVELATVITILSIVAAGGLNLFGRSLEFSRIETTKERQAFITQAMEQYVKYYGHLPCPASLTAPTTDATFGVGGGTGDDTSPACTSETTTASKGTVVGAIPTGTLGIPHEYMFDGWNHRFTYVTDEDLAYAGDASTGFLDSRTTTQTTDVNFDVTKSPNIYSSEPNLTVVSGTTAVVGTIAPFAFSRSATEQEAIDDNLSACDGSTSLSAGDCIPTTSAFAIISHGKNGFGAYRYQGPQITTINSTPGTYEARNSIGGLNTDFNTIYQLPQNRGASVPTDYFDDIIVSRTKAQLQNLE
jgi:prepilin-type N-terminal cleavage/methylation domain-containing protein